MDSSILICIESFYDGGAEMFAIRLANALARTNQIFFLELEPYRSLGKSQKKLLDKKIEVFPAGVNVLGNLLHSEILSRPLLGRLKPFLTKIYTGAKRKSILRFLRKHNIQKVNSHSWSTDYYFSTLKNIVEFTLVATLHGHYELFKSINVVPDYTAKTVFLLQKLDTIVYTTNTHVETLKEYNVDMRKMHKIYYGMDFNPMSVPTVYQGPHLKVVLVARGLPEKGWELLIDAVNRLLKSWPDAIRLTLIGDSCYVDELRDKYSSKNIVFGGYKDHVIPIIQEAHVCVLPTYFVAESMPNSVIEYLSCGKPVIATDVGSIKDMISNGDEMGGTILTLKNGKPEVSDLANALELYLKKPDMVKKHSYISIKASHKFLMSFCTSEYIKVLEGHN